jgi:hypothetical protein
METQDSGLGAEVREEDAGTTSVFGGNHGDQPQQGRGARGEIVQVAEWCGDDEEGAGSRQGSLGGER